LLKGVIVGAVMAVSLIPGWMAVAPLLFRGTLSPHVPVCLGMLLLGSIVAGMCERVYRRTVLRQLRGAADQEKSELQTFPWR